ncbi:MAG: TIGR04282 family arsenosugar biosynthesis glycosyltransferase [Noviherbaspirillum sp.]
MSRRHVAIFTRAPVAGAAKTRLIPLLGAQGAADAQRRMTWHALQTACALPGASVSLWCAGDIAHPFLRLCASHFGVDCVAQCEGGLGMRMADCLQRLLAVHEQVLLTGSDCPAMSVADLADAAAALEEARMVFIPAQDGGYVLVGARRGGLEARCFDEVAWGSAEVMAQTRAQLLKLGWSPSRDWREMPALWDVDTPEDFERARRLDALPRNSHEA